MTALLGTNIAAPIMPFTAEDVYPTHDALYGKGGWRSVSTYADMLAIPLGRRTRGMQVSVTDDPVTNNNALWEWTGVAFVISSLSAGGSALPSVGIFTGATSGVVGGIGVDETDNILAAINAVGPGGGELIIRALDPNDPIYINGPLPIENSNLTLRFQGLLLMGPGAYVRVNGGLQEVIRTERGQVHTLKLRAASYTDGEGRLVLPLETGGGTFLDVDDQVVIRGQNDAYGKAFNKQVTKIISISGDDAVCADEPDETYQPTYPGSDWPSDITTGTTISIAAFSSLTADVAEASTATVTVTNTGFFTLGALCYINDSQTEASMMAEMDPPVTSTLSSACNMEIARIVAIDAEASTLTFDRHLERPFLVSKGAGVTVMAPVVNTHLKADLVEWAAPQPDRKNSAFAINYSDGCTIEVAKINGKAGRKGAAARIGYSHDCHIFGTRAVDAYSFGSAEGYGLTLYYSTKCTINRSVGMGNRHNFLLQATTLCEVVLNYSGDDWISGIDAHGANCYGNLIAFNTVTRSINHAPGVTNGGGIRIGNTSHTIGDHGTVVRNNWIIGYLGDKHAAIDISPSSRDTQVIDNVIVKCQVGFRHYKVSGSIPEQHANHVLFQGNTLEKVAEPFDIENYDGNSYWDALTMLRNTFIECGPVVVWDLPKLICKENDVIRMKYVPGTYAFDFRGIADLRVYGCSADGAARAARVTNCGKAKVVRNWFGDSIEGQSVIDGGGNTTLINLDNSDGIPDLALYQGGDTFGTSIGNSIEGGSGFGSTTADTIDGGNF